MCKNAPLHECIDALGSSLLASDTKRIAAIFFLHLTNPAILSASKLAKNRVIRGVGLFLI